MTLYTSIQIVIIHISVQIKTAKKKSDKETDMANPR